MADTSLGPERTAEIAITLLAQSMLERRMELTTESCREFVEELRELRIPLPEALQFADMFLVRMTKEMFRRAQTSFVGPTEPPPTPPADEQTGGSSGPSRPPEDDEVPF